MAIIKKDGFEFYVNSLNELDSIIINGGDLSEEISYIKKNKLKAISLNYFKSKAINDLEFLKEIDFIEKVIISDLDIDYNGLYFLRKLTHLTIDIKHKSQHLNFGRFPDLENLSINWYSNFPEFNNNNKLKYLTVWKFKPKSKSLNELVLPNSLISLKITESNITNLEGLNGINLENLEGYYCKKLSTLNGLKELKKSLKNLILDYCNRINDFNELRYCSELEKIILGDCGEMENLSWLLGLKKVKHFSFWNTKLIDGDTSPCFGIDYVNFKNTKNYNHSLEEFKKNKITKS